jgi:hypothetical protein
MYASFSEQVRCRAEPCYQEFRDVNQRKRLLEGSCLLFEYAAAVILTALFLSSILGVVLSYWGVFSFFLFADTAYSASTLILDQMTLRATIEHPMTEEVVGVFSGG